MTTPEAELALERVTPAVALRPTTYLRKNMFGSSADHRALPSGPRALLWVDAVGGFLVCLGNAVTLGQPDTQRGVDVPILGDLSARHLTIRREGEGYLACPRRPIKINGRPIESPVALAADCELELGVGVRFRFRRPHPLSATAQLLPLSRHRTQPTTDGVLLVAESLILGPEPTSHIVCPAWPHAVQLFRRGAELWCRAPGGVEIDGARHAEAGPMTLDSRVSGAEFTLSLEAV